MLFGWEGKKTFMWGPHIFHPAHTKFVPLKWRKYLVERVWRWNEQSPIALLIFLMVLWATLTPLFFITFFILFYILNSWAWCFVFFFCLIRNDFFPRNDFLNKFGYFFFSVAYYLFILIRHHFLIRVYE